MVSLEKNSVKAFIFDVGGTLVKTDEAILKALTYALWENGIHFINHEEVVNAFGQGNRKNVATAVERSYHGADLQEKINQCYTSYKRIFPTDVIDDFSVIHSVFDGLQYLKNKKMQLAVLTGFDQPETEFFLEKMQLNSYFDVVLSAEDIVEHRPHPRGLLLAVEKLGLRKEECLYIGDAMVDIDFGRNAGVKVACVKTGAQDDSLLEHKKPDYLWDTLADVKSLFD